MPSSTSLARQERLRDVEASNLFLVALDRRREWYRYHALFREFLLGELRRVEPEVIAKLHLRAADWYEANGSPAMAIEHLLNTTERDRCVQLVTALALPTYEAGQMSTVQRWLSALGDSAIVEYPPLAVLAGWVAVLTGQTTEAQRWAAIVDAASFEPGARGRHGVVRLGAGDVAGRHVCRRPRADAGRRELRGRPGAAVESVARHRAVPVRRGASAGGGRRRAARPVRRVVRRWQQAVATPTSLVAQRVRARAAGMDRRAMG